MSFNPVELRGEYRVTIASSQAHDWALYSVAYVYFEGDEIREIQPLWKYLTDTDPGVVAGTLAGARRAFEKPPVDLRGEKPVVRTDLGVLKP